MVHPSTVPPYRSEYLTWARSKVSGREVLCHLASLLWVRSSNKHVGLLRSGALPPLSVWTPTLLPLRTSQTGVRHPWTLIPLSSGFPDSPRHMFLQEALFSERAVEKGEPAVSWKRNQKSVILSLHYMVYGNLLKSNCQSKFASPLSLVPPIDSAGRSSVSSPLHLAVGRKRNGQG